LLPPLDRLPPRPPRTLSPERPEQLEHWQRRLRELALELETVEADQRGGPLTPQERRRVRQVYCQALDRCRRHLQDLGPGGE